QRQEPSIPAALGAVLRVRGIRARRPAGLRRRAMMRRATAVLVFDLLLALARPASAPAAAHQPWQRAPAEAQATTNPFERDSDAARAGGKLFARHCASCHGDQGRGGEAPHLDADLVGDATPGDLFWFLTNGNLWRGMPSWSRLPDQRRWQLVTFLKT